MAVNFNWQGLPQVFRKSVVKDLDFYSRCSLRKCSRADCELVNAAPFKSDRVAVSVYRNSVTLHVSNAKIEYFNIDYAENTPLRTEFTAEPGEYPKKRSADGIAHGDLDLVIQDFVLLVSHEDSMIDKVVLQYAEGINPERSQLLNRKLLGKMKSMGSQWKIRTSSFYISYLTTGEEMLDFVSFVDADKVSHIRIKHMELTDEELGRLVEMEQWKRAKSLFLEEKNAIPVQCYLHLDTFWTNVNRLDSEDAWNVIKNYIKLDPPHGAFFYIGTSEKIDLESLLKNFDSPIKNEPIPTPWPSSHVLHTQRFSLASEGHVLIVLILNNLLTGRVSHMENLISDCTNFYGGYYSG